MLGALVLLQMLVGGWAWRRAARMLAGLRLDQRILAESKLDTDGSVSEALDALADAAYWRCWVGGALTVHPMLYLFLPEVYRRWGAVYVTQAMLVALAGVLLIVIRRQERERAILSAIAAAKRSVTHEETR